MDHLQKVSRWEDVDMITVLFNWLIGKTTDVSCECQACQAISMRRFWQLQLLVDGPGDYHEV